MCGSFEEIDDTYISGSISVSQQNITKLEHEAGYRHANQALTRNIVCTFSRNGADECHTHDCFPSRVFQARGDFFSNRLHACCVIN